MLIQTKEEKKEENEIEENKQSSIPKTLIKKVI